MIDPHSPMAEHAARASLRVQQRHAEEYRAGRFYDPIKDPQERQAAYDQAIAEWKAMAGIMEDENVQG